MISRRLVLGAGFAALYMQGASAADTPEARIKGIYDQYVRAGRGGNGPDQLNPRIYSARRRAQITRLRAACRRKELCMPDADFFIDGQNFQITQLVVARAGGTDARPVVEARFRNFNEPSTIRFELVREEGRGWVIDQMRGPGGGTLDDYLKPNF